MIVFVQLVLYCLGFSVVLGSVVVSLTWFGLRWLCEQIAPVIVDAWQMWEHRQSEARKPDDMMMAGATARHEIDQIITQYSQQVDQVIQADQTDQPLDPEIITLTEQNYYEITEDTHVK